MEGVIGKTVDRRRFHPAKSDGGGGGGRGEKKDYWEWIGNGGLWDDLSESEEVVFFVRLNFFL